MVKLLRGCWPSRSHVGTGARRPYPRLPVQKQRPQQLIPKFPRARSTKPVARRSNAARCICVPGWFNQLPWLYWSTSSKCLHMSISLVSLSHQHRCCVCFLGSGSSISWEKNGRSYGNGSSHYAKSPCRTR